MLEKMKKDLFELLNIYAPSREERPVSQYLLDKIGGKVDDFFLDEHGNLIMNKKIGTGDGATVILSSHMDSVPHTLNDADNREIVEKTIEGVDYIFSQLPEVELEVEEIKEVIEEIEEDIYPEEPFWWVLASKSNRMFKKDFKEFYDYYVLEKPFNSFGSKYVAPPHPFGQHGGVAGGDDRCGIAIILSILDTVETKTNFNGTIKLVFPVAEEIGCVGSSLLDPTLVMDADLAIVIDRKGNSDIVKSNGGYQSFCSQTTVDFFEYCSDLQELGFKGCNGGLSDASSFASLGINSVNLSAGYYDEHTDRERIVFDDMVRTYKLVLQVFGSVNDWMTKEGGFGVVPKDQDLYGWGGSYGNYTADDIAWEEEQEFSNSLDNYEDEDEIDGALTQYVDKSITNKDNYFSSIVLPNGKKGKAYYMNSLARIYLYDNEFNYLNLYEDVYEKKDNSHNDIYVYTSLDEEYVVVYNTESKAQLIFNGDDVYGFTLLMSEYEKQ